MQDILLSKIASNPTDSAWSQAYSTINFYVALSTSSSDMEKSSAIASSGKEILERLQREFFALDEKNLETIKQAVANVTQILDPSNDTSILLATLSKNILYVISYNCSQTILARHNNLGVVSNSENNQLTAFSGRLQPNDILILETAGFAQRFPPTLLQPLIKSNNVVEISESLTPKLLEKPTGTEAAVIMQYVGTPESTTENPLDQKEEQTSQESDKETVQEPASNAESQSLESPEPGSQNSTEQIPLEQKTKFSLKLPSLPKISFNRKQWGIAGVVVLVAALIISIILDQHKRASLHNEQILQGVLVPAQKDLADAQALSILNKPLALEKIQDAQALLVSGKNKLPPGSSEVQQINSMLDKVHNELQTITGGTTLNNQKLIFDASSKKSIGSISFVSFNGTELIVAGQNGSAAVLSTDGSVKKIFTGKPTTAFTADDTYAYEAGDKAITQINLSSGTNKQISDNAPQSSNIADIKVYDQNLYLLNNATQDVEKYAGSSYSKSSYFKNSTHFQTKPTSIAIDGSIWIIEQSGNIHKFTRGVEQPFTVSGLSSPFGPHTLIYTDVGYDDLYILDKDNNRIVVVGKDGTYKNQYQLAELKNASSFSVYESGKIAYFVTNNKLFSIAL